MLIAPNHPYLYHAVMSLKKGNRNLNHLFKNNNMEEIIKKLLEREWRSMKRPTPNSEIPYGIEMIYPPSAVLPVADICYNVPEEWRETIAKIFTAAPAMYLALKQLASDYTNGKKWDGFKAPLSIKMQVNPDTIELIMKALAQAEKDPADSEKDWQT